MSVRRDCVSRAAKPRATRGEVAVAGAAGVIGDPEGVEAGVFEVEAELDKVLRNDREVLARLPGYLSTGRIGLYWDAVCRGEASHRIG